MDSSILTCPGGADWEIGESCACDADGLNHEFGYSFPLGEDTDFIAVNIDGERGEWQELNVSILKVPVFSFLGHLWKNRGNFIKQQNETEEL